MKELIFDKLRRGWLIWSLYTLVFFTCGLVLPLMSGVPHFQNWWWILYLSFLTNSTTELNAGYGRVVLTLPFTTRQVGKFLWLVSVAMPTLLLASFSALGILIAGSYSKLPSEIFLLWIQLVLMGGLIFGSIFWINSGAPLNPSEKWQRHFASQTYGIGFWLALFGGGYLLYKCHWNSEIKFFAVALLGLTFTVLGWLRAEELVVDYSEYRPNASTEIKVGGNFKPQSGFGGIRLLMTNSFLRMAGVMLVIFGILVAFNIFKTHNINLPRLAEDLPMSQIWFFFFILGDTVNLLLHLKFLRTLPLTSKQLAGVILAIALLPFFISSVIIAGLTSLNSGIPVALSLFKAYFLGLAPVSVMVTAAVWHGEKRLGRIILTVAIFLVTSIAPIYQLATGVWNSGKSDLPTFFVVGYPIVFMVLALFAISRLLEANDMTYRIRPRDVRGFNQMDWSR